MKQKTKYETRIDNNTWKECQHKDIKEFIEDGWKIVSFIAVRNGYINEFREV